MRSAKNASPVLASQLADATAGEDGGADDDVSTATIPLAIANIALDVRSPLPLHEQICQAIRSAIWAGELPPKTLLPTTRELARHLGVARNTVVFAYARLAAEGLCVSNTRRGTRVASDLQQRPSFSEPNAEDASVGSGLLRVAFQAKSAMELPVDRSASGAPFAGYTFDPVQYPRTKLGRRLADKFLGAPSTHQFGSSTGRFQSTITDYLRQARGVMCDPSQVIAVSGLEGALDLVARVLVDPGDSVAIEDPCADFVHSVFRAAKAYVRPIPSDAFGADPKRMSGPPARLLYVSPSVSFPFGLPMPSARRQEILAAARAQNALIIENDSCFELRYSGASLYSVQGQDRDGREGQGVRQSLDLDVDGRERDPGHAEERECQGFQVAAEPAEQQGEHGGTRQFQRGASRYRRSRGTDGRKRAPEPSRDVRRQLAPARPSDARGDSRRTLDQW